MGATVCPGHETLPRAAPLPNYIRQEIPEHRDGVDRGLILDVADVCVVLAAVFCPNGELEYRKRPVPSMVIEVT